MSNLGTATDAGLDVLRGSTRYQHHDARPSGRAVVITLQGTVVGDVVQARGSPTARWTRRRCC